MRASYSVPIRMLVIVLDSFPFTEPEPGVSRSAKFLIIRRLQGCLYSILWKSSFLTILGTGVNSEGHHKKAGHPRSKPKPGEQFLSEKGEKEHPGPVCTKNGSLSVEDPHGVNPDSLVRRNLMTTRGVGILVAIEPTEEGGVGTHRNTLIRNRNGKIPR